jgi:hypothetical protein
MRGFKRLRAVKLPFIAAAFVAIAGSIVVFSTHNAQAVSIWSSSVTPSVTSENDSASVEVGMKFRSSVATTVTGVKFYKGSGNTGTHTGSLWTSSGTQLASVTFTGETATGWQTANFATPVAISANTTYVVSYHAPNGHYAVDEGFFANQSVTSGTLTALQNGTDGGNGVYKYGSAVSFPNATYNSSNYWVDVTTGTADTTPPTVSLTAPTGGSTVSGSVTVSATASDDVAVSTVQFKVDGVNIGAADTTSPYSVSWDSTGASNGTHTLTAVATDSSNNSTTSSSVSVTVSNQTPTTATSIWPNTTTPAVLADSDNVAVELGTKFRSSVATTVTGVKFYKGTTNTGTHTGSLWSSTGTRLATGTFTGETASGWQTLTFATPVAISANTTYVASYHAPNGHYSVDDNYFATAHTNLNLTALASGTDGGNGVYVYGASAFPSSSYNASNYWVDVVTSNSPSDTTPPTVSATTPATNATSVDVASVVTATMSESLTASTVNSTSVSLKDPLGATVSATVTYDDAQKKITLTPSSSLEQGTVYTVTLTTALKDSAGNALAANYVWSFTTQASTGGTVSPLAQGHDGPILIVTKSRQLFSEYYSEILRAEGLNSFKTVEVGGVNGTLLANYSVVILGDMSLTDSQVTTFTNWVNAGGNLIAMHPDKKLAGLLGLTDQSAILSDSYLKVNTSSAPGTGITDQTIQYHGNADKYTANSGTTTVATLYSNATTTTSNPAVTLRAVGSNGGQAAAFTYDLARSVVYTHQGNPSWSGQDRDGNGVIRPNDLFYGAMSGDVQNDYVDLNKVAIPQADEQQRLLANLIEEVNKDKAPLPKLSYLPYNDKVVVVLAADDHATSNGSTELDYQLAQSTSGCSVADWECVRSTTLMYTNTPMTDTQALGYYNQGFDFGVHTSTNCADWTATSLATAMDGDIAAFQAAFPSLPAQHVNRIHCIAWSDYTSAAKYEAGKGLRVDLNYYYWPGSWVQNRPGFMTGSGLDMRFADTDGTMIDTYQLPSHLVNESGQTWPQNIDTMLERAQGPEGYYGILGTHYDYSDSFDRQLIQSAKTHGVRLVSGQQILDWTDGRNASYFTNANWSGTTYNFTATIDSKLRQMARALVPVSSKNGVIVGVTKDSQSVTYTTETMKGITYAVIPVTSGTYSVVYGQDTTPPTVTSAAPVNGASGVSLSGSVSVNFSEPLDSSTVNSSNVQLLNGASNVAVTVSYVSGTNTIKLTPTSNLSPTTTYTVSISTGVKDANGVGLASTYTTSFTTGENAFSLWAPAAQTVSTASDNDVELGLRFQSSQNGTITKITFYKPSTDTATTHTVTLWDSTGVSLGTATTTSETASGWQTAVFAAPVAITASTQYVASYRATTGQYSYTASGLSANVTNGPLTALANGGLYKYGGGFPDQSFNGNNYWVDVVFAP